MDIDWIRDLDQLKTQLPALHKKTFSSQEKASFSAHIKALKQRLSSLDTYSVATQIARIVASLETLTPPFGCPVTPACLFPAIGSSKAYISHRQCASLRICAKAK